MPSLGTEGFTGFTDYLIGGDGPNGVTAMRGADTVGNAEGVPAGRVIRLRVTGAILESRIADH
ncbi:MAG: hypothetical protein ACJ731_04585 [Vicinamibacterales bacterium]